MAQCYICQAEMPEPDEEPKACKNCGAITIVVGPDSGTGTDVTLVRGSYHNDGFEMRACDHCGREYRGPAVYCSLDCALADA